MSRPQPIKVGDKFKLGGRIVESIGTKPGGKVELFDRERALFTDRWHRDVIVLERVAKSPDCIANERERVTDDQVNAATRVLDVVYKHLCLHCEHGTSVSSDSPSQEAMGYSQAWTHANGQECRDWTLRTLFSPHAPKRIERCIAGEQIAADIPA